MAPEIELATPGHPGTPTRGLYPRISRRLYAAGRRGVVGGLRQGAWLLALMIPISLLVTLLRLSGILGAVARWLGPAFRLLGLPGESGIALITAAAVNLYSGIAVLGSIPLTDRQVTIVALFMLICHNLPVEMAVLHKAGTAAWRTVLLRVAAAVAAAAVLNLILPAGDLEARTRGVAEAASTALPAALAAWAVGTAWFTGKVLLIVVGLMILHAFLEEFRLARRLTWLLRPILALLGLPHRTGFLWMVANTLGLAYGAAVIVEEARSGRLPPEDRALVNRSVAVCHSLLEDTLLLVAIGAWAFWITVPRVALAGLVVWGYRAGRHLRAARRALAHQVSAAPGEPKEHIVDRGRL